MGGAPHYPLTGVYKFPGQCPVPFSRVLSVVLAVDGWLPVKSGILVKLVHIWRILWSEVVSSRILIEVITGLWTIGHPIIE